MGEAKRIKLKHLLLPFIAGLVWFLSTPTVSIITGENRCRHVFTDEHQLDPRQYSTPTYSNEVMRETFKMLPSSNESPGHNMCDVLDFVGVHGKEENVTERIGFDSSHSLFACHRHDTFDVLKILPRMSPVAPVEALVVVFPSSQEWIDSNFHLTFLNLIENIKKKSFLSKAILLVSPHDITVEDKGASSHDGLEGTVRTFLGAYGAAEGSFTRQLPNDFTTFLIRQLLVVDMEVEPEFESSQFYVLPQGRRGILPNLDILSLASSSFRYNNGLQDDIMVHPFNLTWWEEYVDGYFPLGPTTTNFRRPNTWGKGLGNMIAFMISSAIGPHGAHAPALDAGIDSVTLRLKINNNDESEYAKEIDALGQVTEHILRGLNSLSERLHHNMNQYLMISLLQFVSHSEYLVPCILILLPLLLRSIKLIFELETFVLKRTFQVVLGAACASGVLAITGGLDLIIQNMVFTLVYFAMLLKFSQTLKRKDGKQVAIEANERTQQNQSLQLVTCLLAIYLHVPLALANISLALPSALLWTPLLAFPSFKYRTGYGGKLGNVLMAICIVVLFPPSNCIPGLNASFDSIYICAIYMPLHFLLSALWLC